MRFRTIVSASSYTVRNARKSAVEQVIITRIRRAFESSILAGRSTRVCVICRGRRSYTISLSSLGRSMNLNGCMLAISSLDLVVVVDNIDVGNGEEQNERSSIMIFKI
jgi:hypothetical protein